MNGIEPVNEIILRGECMEPKLLFNMKEVILPVVPVGFRSWNMFKIVNFGYTYQRLTWKLDNIDNLKLKIEFLDELRVDVHKKEVLVKVNFSSDFPISFTKKLTFFD